ncbi:hypothetical protein SKAU_G00066100 [Synaphobranchus kaupii]|uniref:Uncharacterized protein n=1 Tax=Synaphobranchus kaupii TaxID=118154 RepID=A0A9Q1G628_SYNKA|nr:hypothetical protein SKAU_G00066100 [Synaphobranchus kaupii]
MNPKLFWMRFSEDLVSADLQQSPPGLRRCAVSGLPAAATCSTGRTLAPEPGHGGRRDPCLSAGCRLYLYSLRPAPPIGLR